MPMKVLVTSANGRTGRAVTEAIGKAGVIVRAFIRDASQGLKLHTIGAGEIALGDLTDPSSLMLAAQGCKAIVYIGPPMDGSEVERVGHALEAAKAKHVEHFIYYSVMHPLRRDVQHHRLKLDAEEAVIESGLPYTILQPCRYMQHLEPIWSTVKQTGVHAMPFDIDKRFNLVDVIDLGAAVANVVCGGSAHHWATYELAGSDALSMRDIAALLSRKLGREIVAKQTSIEQLASASRAKGYSEDRIAQMSAMNEHYNQYGFKGNSNILTWLLGRTPTSFSDYVGRISANE
jgi:uncharacterized protein YbjT (DUF2867 family)